MKRARRSVSPPSVARCVSSSPPASALPLTISSLRATVPSASSLFPEPFVSSPSSAASRDVDSLGRLLTDSALRLTLDIGATVCASLDAADLGRLVMTARSLHRMLRHAVGVAPGAYIPNRIVAADTDPLWRAAFMRGVRLIERHARRLVRLYVAYDHDGTAVPTTATMTAIVAASRATLQTIDLMDVSYTAHPELLRALCNCPQLARLELDVSERADANRWTEVVAEAASHKMPRLTELEVVGDAIRPDSNAPVVVLGAMLRSCTHLRTLHIDDLPYDCIARLPASLANLTVTLRHRMHAGGGATAASLRSCVVEFANVLGNLNQLETLMLWCCNIPGRESALDQLAPLVLPPSLRHLQLYEDDTDGRSRPRRWPPVRATHDFQFRACANVADVAGILRCTPHLRHLEVSGPRNPADRYLGARALQTARAEFVAAVRDGGGASLECARFERVEFTPGMIRAVFECWRNLRTLSCEVSSAALLETDRLLETRRPPTLVNWRFVGAHAKSMSGDGTASAQRVFELSSF